MLRGHTDDRRNAGWWRALAWALAALARLASGFVASLLSPLIACFCCGPFGGVLSGAAACAAPPGASRSEASRVSALGGLAYGVGAWIGMALAIALGLATGAVQQAQREFLRRLVRRGFPGDGDGRPGDRDRPGPLPGRRRAASDLRRRRLAGREGGPGPSRP
jgi:hypothetical protein